MKENKVTEEVICESPQKNAKGISYMTVRKNSNSSYIYSQRLGINSVAFILYDRTVDTFCAISERKPPLDFIDGGKVFLTTAFGGSIDKDVPMEVIVQTEVREEAGYNVSLSDIECVGSVMVSTQSNQMCYLYLVTVDDSKICPTEPQSIMEAEATLEWFKYEDAHNFSDWKLSTILFKAKSQQLI